MHSKFRTRSLKLKTLPLWLVWLAIGIGLRLMNLTAKPPWTDEFSTLVFSLGNSFLPVPLDKPISIDILLRSLQPQAGVGVKDVLTHLLSESNHPPLYFILTHYWTKLFPTQDGLVSLWGARSLAAFLGGLSVPAIYALSRLTFRSRLVSHLAAALMATSPYGIFLAQEARHYTLAILWVIASLACLVITTRHIKERTQLPLWIAFCWTGINALGIASHYFFALTLCAEAFVLLFLAWQQWGQGDKNLNTWLRIYAVAAGTLISGLVWLPVFLQNSYGNKLTDWIQSPQHGMAWINPIFQSLAAWITMICLLPVEAANLVVVVISGIIMLIFFVWVVPILLDGFKVQLKRAQTSFMMEVFTVFVVGASALFFIITYCFGIDLTRGARYNFVYFPAVIILVGASLAVCWRSKEKVRWGVSGKQAVAIVLVMGLVSTVTVTCNLGYQKYYRPDLFVQIIQKTSRVPVLIATTQKTHVHIGEMMGVAREFKIQNLKSTTPQFLLAHQDEDPKTSTNALQNTLKGLSRPLDLWVVNFYAPLPEEIKNCAIDSRSLPAINGYKYKLYHCR
ncbi:phospholipid carrier-dependent glycosyltransferase [Scytonema sp. NUACC26]|uniref:glycosyltransferase family 39 protein n=1 Tax=Scytonema sp. NUACC26 TaxID=3140176 RepID=UPI0034DBD215